jgi:hypothetical protein
MWGLKLTFNAKKPGHCNGLGTISVWMFGNFKWIWQFQHLGDLREERREKRKR